MGKKKDEIARLRRKLIDAEDEVCRLEDINNLFMPFAIENSPEGVVVAELISDRIKTCKILLSFDIIAGEE